MNIDKMLDVMIAYTNGQRIKCHDIDSDNPWLETTTPLWNWNRREYDIIPKDIPPADHAEVTKKIEVMQAFKAGRGIEVKATRENDKWRHVTHPMWDWQHYEYRIAEFDAKAVLKQVRDCSATWEEATKLFGSVAAGDIVKAIDEVLK